MHVSDDIYCGLQAGGTQALSVFKTAGENPTAQFGVGPLARIFTYDIVPVALAANNIALSQTGTGGTALTLTAGAGVTLGTAPDGSGNAVLLLDVPRALQIISAGTTAANYLVTGYDFLGRKTTQLVTGPTASTVTTLKAFASILSIVPSVTPGAAVTIGTADKFGLPWCCLDAGRIIRTGWANTLAANAGTFAAGDTTNPATNLTGDPRGTYAQAGAASNGSNRLVVSYYMPDNAAGPLGQIVNAIGVTPA